MARPLARPALGRSVFSFGVSYGVVKGISKILQRRLPRDWIRSSGVAEGGSEVGDISMDDMEFLQLQLAQFLRETFPVDEKLGTQSRWTHWFSRGKAYVQDVSILIWLLLLVLLVFLPPFWSLVSRKHKGHCELVEDNHIKESVPEIVEPVPGRRSSASIVETVSDTPVDNPRDDETHDYGTDFEPSEESVEEQEQGQEQETTEEEHGEVVNETPDVTIENILDEQSPKSTATNSTESPTRSLQAPTLEKSESFSSSFVQFSPTRATNLSTQVDKKNAYSQPFKY
ncbi:Nvj1p KNAG_0M00280 [Huiozyma naganishii CBS 8797]|uniref:Uncharacterized protein n=1 Tax=Huiozyma naganishii (strain ATCC MYA-139 / BCRC 22969 / CBS 8797 / KCTC 17520 / NBRC 10181 / NCYC 3082 / Yp74L-3) TaxID=1071383 RepID=J7SBA1_HUIN7|nr:hypothetical protein KNAG_0M00280 [Kazachstania naganishii CBS 8797]CCK72881.1 hypothetical protein KNAG_0M00280 [Kazachstania naganishii CBS 8797]